MKKLTIIMTLFLAVFATTSCTKTGIEGSSGGVSQKTKLVTSLNTQGTAVNIGQTSGVGAKK